MAEDRAVLEQELERRTRELHSTREQLRNLIERNGDAILVVDQDGLVRFANPAAERLFGLSARELVGNALGLPVVVGETTEIDIVGQGDAAGVAEMRVVETEWGGQHARLAVLRDITERKRAEQEREQLFREQTARAQAEQALRERDEFMALASHELKTPVSTLSATAQLLQRQLDRQDHLEPEQVHRALERVHDQARRLARLVEHLLDVSRINAGRLTLQPEKVDIRTLVESVVTSCQMTTARHALRLLEGESIETFVDPIRIEEVLTNLIDNAIKYSPEGGEIDVEVTRGEPGAVRIAVRDHGIGIPTERRERLFERFYRAHGDGHISGLGLGLFISKHILDAHGGRITVESPPGGGSRFVASIPIGQAQDVH